MEGFMGSSVAPNYYAVFGSPGLSKLPALTASEMGGAFPRYLFSEASVPGMGPHGNSLFSYLDPVEYYSEALRSHGGALPSPAGETGIMKWHGAPSASSRGIPGHGPAIPMESGGNVGIAQWRNALAQRYPWLARAGGLGENAGALGSGAGAGLRGLPPATGTPFIEAEFSVTPYGQLARRAPMEMVTPYGQLARRAPMEMARYAAPLSRLARLLGMAGAVGTGSGVLEGLGQLEQYVPNPFGPDTLSGHPSSREAQIAEQDLVPYFPSKKMGAGMSSPQMVAAMGLRAAHGLTGEAYKDKIEKTNTLLRTLFPSMNTSAALASAYAGAYRQLSGGHDITTGKPYDPRHSAMDSAATWAHRNRNLPMQREEIQDTLANQTSHNANMGTASQYAGTGIPGQLPDFMGWLGGK